MPATSPTPTPAPQNKSIKSGHYAVSKVQGEQITTQVDIKFDDPADYDNFAAGKLPINFILKNTASGQTVTLGSRLLTENFRPAADKSAVTVHLIIDNLTTPVWDAQGCIETSTNAENAARDDGVNITVAYAACESAVNPIPGVGIVVKSNNSARRTEGNPVTGVIVKGGSNPGTQRTAGGPIGNIVVKGGKNPGGNLMVTPGGSEVTENSEAARVTPTSRGSGVKRTTAVISVSSSKGSGSPKQAGF